jgi:hypothetical protein
MSNPNAEYKSGFVAGITRAIISQPFDTVKTKMQSGNYPNSLVCAKQIIQTEGVKFLYKGIAFPLIGNSFIVGTHFHTYSTYKDKMPSLCVGGLAGLYASFIANPVELVRIKMQLSDKASNNKNYSNSFVCMKNIVKNNGVHGLFKGQVSTSLRDVIGYSSFFYVYANYQPIYTNYFGSEHYYKYELANKMIKGSLCGFALWGSMYPVDVVKTRMQGSLLEQKPLSYLQIVKDVYSQNKLSGFYKGFGMTMFRAIPVNIGIVLAVDFFK